MSLKRSEKRLRRLRYVSLTMRQILSERMTCSMGIRKRPSERL